MTNMFGALRGRPFGAKAAALFGYGLLTFIGVYLVGTLVFDNPINASTNSSFWLR